jgi:hypothetical protein
MSAYLRHYNGRCDASEFYLSRNQWPQQERMTIMRIGALSFVSIGLETCTDLEINLQTLLSAREFPRAVCCYLNPATL